jgi:hypothetical protein
MPIKILKKFGVPILGVEFPEIALPDIPPKIPKLDERQREVLRYAVMDDVADIIPFVGDVAADLAYAELKRLLTPEECERFVKDNKWLPSSLAVLKVFSEG